MFTDLLIKIKKSVILLLVFIALTQSSLSQEVCDNAIDDDGNGQIDLNDAACACTPTVTNIPSLIPNPSFEQQGCCPNSYSQVNCATGWVQATDATSDYMNTCGFIFGAATAAGLTPFPDGNGILGCIFSPGWQEYVGSCLSSSLLAGTEYTLQMNIASTPINDFGDVCNGGSIDFGPINIMIFGATNCSSLPSSTTGCPGSPWTVLGSFLYTPSSNWGTITIDFTPSTNIATVMIGSPCTLPASYTPPSNCYPYFYFDNMLLNTTSNFSNITVTQTDGCVGDAILQAVASAPGGSWQWYKNGIALVGQTSANLNLTANNYTPGLYNVRYSSSTECSIVDFDVLSIPHQPQIGFSWADQCPNTAVNFTSTSSVASPSTITAYTWDFGDGSALGNGSSVSHSYTASGQYTTQLTITTSESCSLTQAYSINIFPLPIPSFTVPPVCETQASNFTNTSSVSSGSITSLSWDFGGGNTSTSQTPTHTFIYSAPTLTHSVSLTATTNNNCVATVSQDAIVYPLATANFTVTDVCFNSSVCPTESSTSPASETINAYNWSWGDALPNDNIQSPCHSYVAQGNYTISLTVTTSNGCTDNYTTPVIVHENPTASFTFQNACIAQQVDFINASFSNDGNITSIDWDYGDNNTDANIYDGANTYSADGSYQVLLTIETQYSCTATLAQDLTIFPTPVVDFTFTNVCEGNAMNFTDNTTLTPPGTIAIWAWDFGDNSLAGSGNTTSHSYTNDGNYNVTLTATSSDGCSASNSHQITAFPDPVASFTVSDVCFGTQVCPSESSTTMPGETITGYDWNWGDSQANDNIQSPCHNYIADGTYTVQLSVTTNNGCTNTFNTPVIIHQIPTADFSFTNVCNGLPVSLTNTSFSNDGNITINNWDYGDLNLDPNTLNGTHVYTTDGIYSVILDIETEFTCTASITKDITIYPSPVVDFSFNNVCENIAMNFTDNSTLAPPGTITDWNWNFGDASPLSSGNLVSHIYTSDANYTASLTVTTSEGCTASNSHQVTAYPEPIPDFNVLPVCETSPSVFTNTSTVLYGTIDAYSWDFGGGNTDNTQSPSYTFTFSSPTINYPVTLTATTNNGCQSTITHNAQVNPLPIANYTVAPQPVCLGLPVNFTDQSTIPQPGIITAWNYNFNNHQGTPIPSTHAYTQNASFTYSTSFTYNSNLTVTSDQGCSNTFIVPVNISPIPYPDFTFDFVCEGTPTTFTNTSTLIVGNITNYSYDFGDGTPVEASANTTHQYSSAGTYPVNLIVISDDNCTDTNTYSVTVNPNPIPNFSANSVCEGLVSSFINSSIISSGSISSYSWNFGDNSALSVANSPTYTYVAANDYQVTLSATSDSGCIETITNQYQVYPNPVANFSYTYLTDSCMPVSVEFTNTSDVATVGTQINKIVTALFNFGDGSTDTVIARPFPHQFSSSGTYDVSIIVTTNHGCVNSNAQSQIIVVYPVPVAEFSLSDNPVTILESSIEFTDASEGNTHWNYDFGDGNQSDLPSPVHAYLDTGSYYALLTITNEFGCTDTASHIVRVLPVYTLYIPNSFTPNGNEKNEMYNAKGEGVKEYEMRIYNRWGEEIFRTKSLDNGWDGKVRNTNIVAQQEVYVYTISTVDYNRKHHHYKGTVTLVR